MQDEDDWTEIGAGQRARLLDWSNDALRGAMLFGVLAVALALFAVPLLDRESTVLAGRAGVDPITTASTQAKSGTYTVRRSVLQRSPSAVCIIRADGTRVGDC